MSDHITFSPIPANPRFQDLTGKTFGRLTVVGFLGRPKNQTYWHCKCTCGNETPVLAGSLTTGHTRSCGCLTREATAARCFQDLTGERFNRLIVLRYERKASNGKNSMWRCRCECGTESVVCGTELTSGRRKSCGCYLREVRGQSTITHGRTRTPEYIVWLQMKARCLNAKSNAYKNYGGRGIAICDEWLGSKGFINFLNHVGFRPSPQHTLDRIDNDKGYTPGNVRWATQTEQVRNRRNTLRIEYKGEMKPLGEWAEIFGIPYKALHARLYRYNWGLDRALTQPYNCKL